MPTYDYECIKCGHAFDEFQSMSDERLTTCPTCGKRSLRRLIGGGLGIIFKGSGFYSTDSRGSSNGDGGKKSEAASETSSTDSGKSSRSGEDSKSSGSKSGDTGKKADSKAAT